MELAVEEQVGRAAIERVPHWGHLGQDSELQLCLEHAAVAIVTVCTVNIEPAADGFSECAKFPAQCMVLEWAQWDVEWIGFGVGGTPLFVLV